MAVRTARNGKVDWSLNGSSWTNIPDVRQWTFDDKTEPKVYADSSTAGARKRLQGTDDFDGTVDVYIDDGNRFDVAAALGIKKGVTGYFRLYEDLADYIQVPVFIEGVSYGAQIEDGEIVGASIRYASNGTVTYPT